MPLIKTKPIIAILVFFLPLLTQAGGRGAGSSVGGADYVSPASDTAWFLGLNKHIRVCTEVSAHFGTPTELDIQKLIKEAYWKWQQYIEANEVEEHRITSTPPGPLDAAHRIAFDSEMIPLCDGTEDLAFYFGTTPPKVIAPKKSFNDPIAFAFRENYDEVQGWGKGFIWFKNESQIKTTDDFHDPMWNDVEVFKAALMHEIGHTLGMGHVDGTVMDSKIYDYLIKTDIHYLSPLYEEGRGTNHDAAHHYANHIDGYARLALSFYRTETLTGTMTSYFDEVGSSRPIISQTTTFHTFMGRDPIGKIQMRLKLGAGTDILFYQNPVLTISDGKDSKDFPIMMRTSGVYFNQINQMQIFKIYKSDLPLAILIPIAPANGGVFEGFIKDAVGKKKLVTISVNSPEQRWLQVDYAVGLDNFPLFQVDLAH